jgi:hypothetical protein
MSSPGLRGAEMVESYIAGMRPGVQTPVLPRKVISLLSSVDIFIYECDKV